MSETTEILDGRKRILHVLTESHSVLARAARDAIQAQLDAGYMVAVAARESVFAALGVDGPNLRHIGIGAAAGLRPGDPASAFTLHKYYRHIDLVHAHGLHAAALAGAGLTGLPSSMHPAIVASIGRSQSTGMVLQAEKQLIARTATAVLGTTDPIVEEFGELVAISQRAQLPESDTEDIPAPAKSRADIRRQFEVPHGSWLISVPAALIDSPALTTIIEGLSQLPKARADRLWTVIFTGGGRSRSLVESDIVAHFEHMRTAPEYLTVDVVAASDLVVASDRLTALSPEALMELGRPVVFVGSEGTGRAYGDGTPQLDPVDTHGFLAAVEHLSDHPEARATAGLGLRARVAAEGHPFDSEALLALYGQACEADSPTLNRRPRR